jgi:methylaspartate ammonia-lyase
MTDKLEKSIVTGADRLIDVAGKTSKYNVRLGVAQLLLGAAALAKGTDMAESDFRQAVHLAIKNVWR